MKSTPGVKPAPGKRRVRWVANWNKVTSMLALGGVVAIVGDVGSRGQMEAGGISQYWLKSAHSSARCAHRRTRSVNPAGAGTTFAPSPPLPSIPLTGLLPGVVLPEGGVVLVALELGGLAARAAAPGTVLLTRKLVRSYGAPGTAALLHSSRVPPAGVLAAPLCCCQPAGWPNRPTAASRTTASGTTARARWRTGAACATALRPPGRRFAADGRPRPRW